MPAERSWIRGALARGRIQHGFDLIPGGQRQTDQVGSGRQLSLAQLVENRLQIVSESGDFVEAEHRARSFDGMQRPECPPHNFGIIALIVQLEQRRFQFAE